MMLTQEKLKHLLDYELATGVFRRRVRTASRVHVGDRAGWTDAYGYENISLLNRTWKSHRLAWLYMTGEWPQGFDIDHINGIRSDNRFANLRIATRSQNLSNSGKRRSNTSGLKGVSFHKQVGKWRASISVRNRQRHIGLFDCPAAAHLAYVIAAHKLHGEFARAG